MAKFAALKYSNLKNEARMKAFLDKFDNKQDFLSLDNTKVKIKKIQINKDDCIDNFFKLVFNRIKKKK